MAVTRDRIRLLAAVKRPIALAAALTVWHTDVVAAWVTGALFSMVAYGVLMVPLWTAVAVALVVGIGVWIVAEPRCWRLSAKWSVRIRRWGAPDTVYSPPPVDHLAALLVAKPVHPAPERKSRSTEPRPLAAYELAGREPCWRCGEPPVEGTHAWDDRGDFQLLSNHTFKCRNGHGWTNSTDGG